MMETIDFEKNLLSEKENELIELMSKKEELSKFLEINMGGLTPYKIMIWSITIVIIIFVINFCHLV